MRISHYIKNLVVFIPLLLDKKLFNLTSFSHLICLFISFCFISSTVYIMNDLKDKKKDCLEPHKKCRPIASNLVTVGQAYFLLMLLLFFSILISGYIECIFFIIAYLLLNIFYSYFLRRFFYIDACCIAFGFILRILASFYLLSLPVNFILLFWMFFTSCFFTFIKRKLEWGASNFRDNKFFVKINESIIKKTILLNALLSFICFAIVLSPYFNIIHIVIILIYLFILGRLVRLSNKKNDFNDPMNFIRSDKLLKILLFLFFLCLCGFI